VLAFGCDLPSLQSAKQTLPSFNLTVAKARLIQYFFIMPVETEHRFSIEDYYQMAQSGVLKPGARVELLGGRIIDILVDLAVEIYREPNLAGYGWKAVLRPGQTAAPQAFPDAAADLADLLRR
jgi:hypothetical protein